MLGLEQDRTTTRGGRAEISFLVWLDEYMNIEFIIRML